MNRYARSPLFRAARVLVLAGTLVAMTAESAPFEPSSPTEVIERLPARSGAEWDAVRALRAELATAPAAEPAAKLAARYLSLFRAEGDPRLIGYAEAAVEPWRSADAPPRDVALQLAALAQMQHHFDEALVRLDALLERDPRVAEAWLSKASIAQVLGRYVDARAACGRLVVLADVLTAGACMAAVQAVTGRADDAAVFFASALERLDSGANAEAAIWVATLAAETAAARGANAEAREYFDAALEASRVAPQIPSIYLLAADADFSMADGRAADALALLEHAPRNDSTLLRIAAAKKLMGLPIETEVDDLQYRLQLALSGQNPAHGREAAYFLLRVRDEPHLALGHAAANFATQREPIDAQLVLEAAVATCSPAEAAPVLEWLSANHVEHAELRALRARLQRSCT